MIKPGFLLGAAVCLALGACASAPVQEMSDARLALRAAQASGAGTRSAATFHQAQQLLNTAESRLQSGNFDGAREDALASRQAAADARHVAEAIGAAQRKVDAARHQDALWTTAQDALEAAQAAAAHGDVNVALESAGRAEILAALGINQAQLERARFELAACQAAGKGPDATALAGITTAMRSDRGADALARVRQACMGTP